MRWVHSPVDKKLKLFQSQFLEFFSKTPWYLVPLVWLPVVIGLAYMSFANLQHDSLVKGNGFAIQSAFLSTLMVTGVFIWTLVEYMLHRFLFHLMPPGDSKFWITMHFFLHGQHHKVGIQINVSYCITVKKANSVLSSIKRTIRYMDKSVFTMLYKSIVRPILEFFGAVWNPHLVKQIKSIESVQRRATKLVPIIKHLSYKDRLTALKLPTLEYRRKRGDMILTYKVLKNHVDTNPSLFFKMNNCSRTRGRELKLFKSRSCLDVRKYVFSN